MQKAGILGNTDKDLLDYLEIISYNSKIIGDNSSARKAVAIVEKWNKGHSKFILTTHMKILLINELWESIDRSVLFYGDETESLFALLEGSSNHEVDKILNSNLLNFSNKSNPPEKIIDEFFIQHSKYGERYSKIIATRGEKQLYAKSFENLDCLSVLTLKSSYHKNAALDNKDRNKKKCIQILYDTGDIVFGKRPKTGRPPTVGGKRGWTMDTLSKKLHILGKSSPTYNFKFDGANGIEEPKKLKKSVVGKINNLIDNKIGWHIFGVTYLNSYHASLILVDKRPNNTFYYWLDQWHSPRLSDNADLPGSIAGFRLYEKNGIDKHIEYFTNYFWLEEYKKSKKEVEQKKRKKTLKLNATVSLWKFYPGK